MFYVGGAVHLSKARMLPSAACLIPCLGSVAQSHTEERTMFTELMPLLRRRRLLLTTSLVEGDTIRATVVPQKASEAEDNAVTTPLAITGTAEELDRDLPQQLVEFSGAHLQLQTTLASAKAEMDAAAKAAREEARKKTSKPPVSTSPATPATPAATPVSREPEAPSLFAPQAQPETAVAEEEEGGEAS